MVLTGQRGYTSPKNLRYPCALPQPNEVDRSAKIPTMSSVLRVQNEWRTNHIARAYFRGARHSLINLEVRMRVLIRTNR
jgi:hypothetical protein